MKSNFEFRIQGRLVIYLNKRAKKPVMIFNRHNIITDEGKGVIMDWLCKEGFSSTYSVFPFTAIVLTNKDVTESVSDTFANSVRGIAGVPNYLTSEGVLHIQPGLTQVTHVQLSKVISLIGTIEGHYGNDPLNNHIKSVCVGMGMSTNTGGPDEPIYSPPVAGQEKIFARVHVGDLIKTEDKSYTFSWTFTIL